MTQYLYLKILRCATSLLLVTCALPMLGQYAAARRSEPRNTTRAVGVVEVDAKGLARLYPVMLMLEGKIYDASLYGSRPVPMAIWGDTVYEVQKSGMPTGLLTVNLARRLKTQWWGEGNWKPFATDEKKDDKSKDKKGEAKKSDAKPTLKADSDDERPTLKKPKAETAPGSTPAGSAEPEKASTVDAKTAEQKPIEGAKTDSKTTAAGETPKAESKPATPSADEAKTAPTKTARKSGPDDPDRPVLRRGNPVGTSQVKDTSMQPYEEVTPAKVRELNAARGSVQSFVAVSDAAPGDNRPFDMQLGPEEQEKYGKEASRQAWGELKKHAGTSAGIPAEPAFANVSVRSFDLDYSNNPVVVYTAEYKQVPAPMKAVKKKGGEAAASSMPPQRLLTYYVTFVGKVDLQGQLNKLFASATDNAHLDATPRLELIDVVDADGDNRAELLFRQSSDIGSDYIIYRGSPYWAKMFEGAGSR
jgi:hypothetical protein